MAIGQVCKTGTSKSNELCMAHVNKVTHSCGSVSRKAGREEIDCKLFKAWTCTHSSEITENLNNLSDTRLQKNKQCGCIGFINQ